MAALLNFNEVEREYAIVCPRLLVLFEPAEPEKLRFSQEFRFEREHVFQTLVGKAAR
jgi:hypothetical protein